MTDYALGRERPPDYGLPTFWKAGERRPTLHALSPKDNKPICGYDGEIEVTDEAWYDTTSKQRCQVCLVRSGADALDSLPDY